MGAAMAVRTSTWLVVLASGTRRDGGRGFARVRLRHRRLGHRSGVLQRERSGSNSLTAASLEVGADEFEDFVGGGEAAEVALLGP